MMAKDLQELKSKALETAQRLIDQQIYGRRESRAISALRKRVPGWERQDYERWFVRALAAHEEVVKAIKDEPDRLWKLYHESMQRGSRMDFTPIAERIHAAHPDFSVQELNVMIAMSFSWRLLR